jgi:hypothetical protein
MPMTTVSTKVTAPHSRRNTAQSTKAKFYRRPEMTVGGLELIASPRGDG